MIGDRLVQHAKKSLWLVDVRTLTRPQRALVTALRLVYVIVRDLAEGQLTLRAMGLVYTTLLSLIPLLAVSFSVLKVFGVHNQIEPFLYNFLEPLGPKGDEIAKNIIVFVDNVKVGVLGSIGIVLLLYTGISLIRKIESAFNFVWKTKGRKSFARTFSDYLSVILIGPLLIFTAMGLTAFIMSIAVVQALVSIEVFGTAVYLLGRLLPYVLVGAAFTFIYLFVPNTKVRLSSALLGGIVAGVLWETVGWAFASFIVTSTRYEAIYSGFAILIMFMIWLYVSWLILLVGAQVAFYHQHRQFLTATKVSRQLSNRFREWLGLAAMFLIAENYYYDREYFTAAALAKRLSIDDATAQDMLDLLRDKGLIVETRDDPPAYLPERDIETIAIQQIHQAVRTADGAFSWAGPAPTRLQPVDRMLDRIDRSAARALKQETLKSLIRSRDEQPPRAGKRPAGRRKP